MAENDLLRIGIVTRPHGVRGEVKVYPTTDDIERFATVGEVRLFLRDNALGAHAIESVKHFKDQVILKLSGVNDMNAAEGLRNAELYIERSQSGPLKEGQYFRCDLLDLKVVLEDGTAVGTVEDVLETAANDVFVIRTEDGKELLLPNIPDCIRNVDLSEGTMCVAILPGLDAT